MNFKQWWESTGFNLWVRGTGMKTAVETAWEAATAAEREACAKVCETVELYDSSDRLKNSDPRLTCADAIRARSKVAP